MTNKAEKATADSFLQDVRDLALDRGVGLEEIKFRMPTGMRCDWTEWSATDGTAFSGAGAIL